MGGKDAAKGFVYQDLCALYRALTLYTEGTGQTLQVEDGRRANKGKPEPWDIKIRNPASETFTTELWQAKDTTVSKNQCCEYWKNLHRHLHRGEILIAAQAEVHQDALLGVITSSQLNSALERFRQFLEILRDYDEMPGRADMEQVWKEDFDGVDLDQFVKLIAGEEIPGLMLFDFESRNNGSVYWFRRFIVEGWTSSSLRDRIENLCGRQLEVNLSATKDFDDLCGRALSLIRTNYGRPLLFDDIVASIRENHRPTTSKRKVVKDILKLQIDRVRTAERPQEPSLEKLFVEPCAEIQGGNSAPEDSKTSYSTETWLRRHLLKQDKDSALTLLLGDFGHGKSTLLKIMAARLAAAWKEGDPIPVFVSLRHSFQEGNNILELVTDAVSEAAALDDETWRSSEWLVLCDGFDELNVLHQDRPDWVRSRFHKLYAASLKPNIKLVISSRPILFMDSSERADYLRPYLKVNLKPFDKQRIRTWLENWGCPLTYDDLERLGLSEVATTPVILLLIAQLHRAKRLSNESYTRRASIYSEFFQWVSNTGGALNANERMRKHFEIPMEILRRIAVLLSSHPKSQAGMMEVPLLLDELKHDSKASERHLDPRLFVRHAFHEGRPNYVEFLHQSLREYLVADHLLHAMFQEEDDGEWAFAPDYQQLLIDRPLTLAEVRFFRDLVEEFAENTGPDLVEQFAELHWWPSLLRDLAEDSWRLAKSSDETTQPILSRVSYSVLGPGRQPIRESRPLRIEIAIANIALLQFLGQAYYCHAANVGEPNRVEGLCYLMNFLSSAPDLEPLLSVLKKAVTGLEFSAEVDVSHLDFSGFDFEGATLDGMMFKGCSFDDTSFKKSVLRGCSFSSCHFSGTRWTSAKLSNRTTFSYCRFLGSAENVPRSKSFHYLDCAFPTDLAEAANLKRSRDETICSNFDESENS
ncbi:NACHT domain-containing protein [Luteolibacter ambystomatis]|uniref:NACHT domain-containing protein n=1 Tax=Luteolibacter ambystomatis TaxID=2824561 RepID=A0A975J1E8_9BACT|nr:NACHT domain-containing protein [Luteolibacter ambystomatis]QUE52261.1 NACHT domain-containing protein [Luteolibacter ambystomatis]